LSAPVAAQSPESAQIIVDQAREAYGAGRYQEAVDGYLAAHALHPDPLLLKNAVKVLALHVGDCPRTLEVGDRYLQTAPERARAEEVGGYQAACLVESSDAAIATGDLSGAADHLERAEALPLTLPARAKVEAARARWSAALAAPVRVEVTVRSADGAPVEDARIEVGGAEVPRIGGAITIPRGNRRVRARAPGYLPAEIEVVAERGARLTLTLTPEAVAAAAPSPPPSQTSGLAWAGWITLGAAAAVGIGAAVVDADGAATIDELEQVAADGTDRDAYERLRDDADSAQTTSAALYGTAAVLAATGGTLLYLGYDDGGDE
jgi:hypothetical protein